MFGPNQNQFIVDGRRGFLPTQDPLTALPERFGVLEDLLQRMPLKLPDGSAGLLGQGRLGAAVDQELPVYDVSRETDPRLLTALFRDLTFLASAYLLEPCDRLYRQTGEYGLGRNVLPRAIAQPLEVVAAKIGAMPFMEYAQSYSLYNYRLRDPSQGLDYNNLDLVRQFSGCPSEHGFILVHVAMVAHTGPLVSSALGVLQGVRDQDRTAFNASLELYRDTMDKINQVMETMWKRSRAEDYMSFRTFIMGTKNQPMFPNGITFEGTPAQSNPRFYRGESGANDSIIPTSDNLFQLTAHMPNNPLTQTLRDFRNYRPKNHHGFVTHMENEANHLRVRDFALRDPQSTALYLENLDWIRAFRHRHWMFTKEYIIKYTSHPVATGGSPIVTWLPNQLSTVLNAINEVSAKLPLSALSGNYRQHIEEIIGRADSQKRVLQREVRELQVRFPNQERFQI
ncbi:hypothetical protein BJ085DRAFT_43082 [Dimargaris cristalligena]|uniref:Indoleamine 2,3-dioxygenase n=1 Tax=Dimargaris cristalligena TaxID=215637 RepID=A0A4P9ZND8_9FUNG|nr:hypothetical protein BJ085DRAFT_43082 [Dimargaris cristalligena]|eukprot:RKP34924.1 hypothetical protein BJ085DRAFT_43082 [Dimargaris cristalligena]